MAFRCSAQGHGCPVERNRLFVVRSIQPEIPLAGLVPATYVFERGSANGREGVDSRNKSGQGGPTVVQVSSAPSHSCSKKLNRTAVAQGRVWTMKGYSGVHYLIASER